MFCSAGYAQLGQFEESQDIGDPKVKGSASYDPASQTYTIKGGGANIWFNHDDFHFLFRKIKGDFILTANFELVGNEDGNNHRKTGWMIRESTEPDAVSINSCVHGDGLVVLQWRLMRGAYMRDPQEEIFFPKTYFGETIIQLSRIGKTITMRVAHPGEPLEEMGSIVLPELNEEVLVGPYALAHDPDEEDLQEVKVWNVRITKPVAADWHPNPLVKTISYDSIQMGSRLETIAVATGERKVLYTSKDAIENPYFSKNGNTIHFKNDNETFEISVNGGDNVQKSRETKEPQPVNSSKKYSFYSAGEEGTNQIWKKEKDGSGKIQMTYDLGHARFPQVSPDGKWIAYLSFPHDSDPKQAAANKMVNLKLLPVDGGGSKTIAYFYGGKGSFGNYAWSPDGKSIVFVSNTKAESSLLNNIE